MMITGVLLAEGAETIDGKLHVYGGAWNTYEVPKLGDQIDGVMVVLMQAAPEDAHATSTEVVGVVTEPDGTTSGGTGLRQHFAEGENRYAILQMSIKTRLPGRYIFRAHIGRNVDVTRTVSVGLTVTEHASAKTY